MDDEDVPLPTHVTLRNGVYQYVRRVPDDIAGSFPSSRIQRSLKTRSPAEARQLSAAVGREVDAMFATARATKGLSFEPVANEGWTWVEWSSFVAWFEATLIHEDLVARDRVRTGRDLRPEPGHERPVWLGDALLKERIALKRQLSAMTAEDYARDRAAHVGRYGARIGVTVSRTSRYFAEIMRACFEAELKALEATFAREGGRQVEHVHPDLVEGPWRTKTTDNSDKAVARTLPAPVEVSTTPARSLTSLIDEWIKQRARLNKKVDPHHVTDMRKTIARFIAHAGIDDVARVERHHVIAFRNSLMDEKSYAIATINKKVGFVTTLSSLAFGMGWVPTEIQGNIHIEIAQGDDERNPYSRDDLTALFAHPVFTSGYRFRRVKAGGELQFWLPLIACTQGMSSSEILHLGPDTVRNHPDADIPCFRVTTAGGRAIKAFARERYLPIRSELIGFGILEVAAEAKKAGRKYLWPAVEQDGSNLSVISNMFSGHWTTFARDVLGKGEPTERKTLYSMRHAFKDELDRCGTPLEIKQSLMGHSDPGTTGRYGTKREPKPVDIDALASTIERLDWPFLKAIRANRRQ